MRKIRPQTSYDDHERYPSVIDERLSRRAFLKAAAGVSVAAGVAGVTGAALVVDPGTSEAGPARRKTYKATLSWSRRYQLKYGNYQIERIVIQTRSAKLARFVVLKKESAGIEKALRKVLDAHSCEEVRSGKRLARLQRRLAKALVARYRKRSKRAVAVPTLVLFVGTAGARCKGDCPSPVPYCKPPRKKRP